MKVHFSKSKSREYALADTTSGTIYFPYDSIYPIFMGIEWGKNDYSLDEEQIRILSIVRNHISGEEALFDDDEPVLFDNGQLVEFDTDNNWITKGEVSYLINSFIKTLTKQINNNIELLNNIDKKFDKYYSKTYINNNYYTKTQIDEKESTINNNISDLTNNFYTKTEIDNNHYSKTEIDNNTTRFNNIAADSDIERKTIKQVDTIYEAYIKSIFNNKIFIKDNIIDIYRLPDDIYTDSYTNKSYCYIHKIVKYNNTLVTINNKNFSSLITYDGTSIIDANLVRYVISDDISVEPNHWYRFSNHVLGILVKSTGSRWVLIDKSLLLDDNISINPFKDINIYSELYRYRERTSFDITHIYKDSSYNDTVFVDKNRSILMYQYNFYDIIKRISPDIENPSIRIVISSSINFDDIKMIDLGTKNHSNNFSITDVFTYDNIIRHLFNEISTIVNTAYPISYNNSFTEEGIYINNFSINNTIEVIPNSINTNFDITACQLIEGNLKDLTVSTSDNKIIHTKNLSSEYTVYKEYIYKYIVKNKYTNINTVFDKQYHLISQGFNLSDDLLDIDINNIDSLINANYYKYKSTIGSNNTLPDDYYLIDDYYIYIKSDVLANYSISFKHVYFNVDDPDDIDYILYNDEIDPDDLEDNNVPVDYTISSINITIHDGTIIPYTKIKFNNFKPFELDENDNLDLIYILFTNNQN